MGMTLLTLFGAGAVALMLVSYALEHRSCWWVLVFALACLACSLYGWLAGTWPFGIGAAVWALVAFRRWWFGRTQRNQPCDADQFVLTQAVGEAQGSKASEEIEDQKAPEDSKDLERAGSCQWQDRDPLEQDSAKESKQWTRGLHWEPLLGIAVLICTALITVFGGTFQPLPAFHHSGVLPPSQASPAQPTKSLKAVAVTTDLQLTLIVTVAPDSPGTNVFTIEVLDEYSKQVSNVTISLSLTTGTSTTPKVVNCQPDGEGGFTAQAYLAPAGYWTVGLQVRTPDHTLHTASTIISL